MGNGTNWINTNHWENTLTHWEIIPTHWENISTHKLLNTLNFNPELRKWADIELVRDDFEKLCNMKIAFQKEDKIEKKVIMEEIINNFPECKDEKSYYYWLIWEIINYYDWSNDTENEQQDYDEHVNITVNPELLDWISWIKNRIFKKFGKRGKLLKSCEIILKILRRVYNNQWDIE